MIGLLFRRDPRSTGAEPHERGDQNASLLFSVPDLKVLYGRGQNCLYLTQGETEARKGSGICL